MLSYRGTRSMLLVLTPALLAVAPLAAAGRKPVCGNPLRAIWVGASAMAAGLAQGWGSPALAAPRNGLEPPAPAGPGPAAPAASSSRFGEVLHLMAVSRELEGLAEDFHTSLREAGLLDPAGSPCPRPVTPGEDEMAKVVRFHVAAAEIQGQAWGPAPKRPGAILQELRAHRDRFFHDHALDAPEGPGSFRAEKRAAYDYVGAVIDLLAAQDDPKATPTRQDALARFLELAAQAGGAGMTERPTPIRRDLGSAQVARHR